MRTAASRMMVNAFFTKDHALWNVAVTTPVTDGMWYGGSSMMKGDGVPTNLPYFFNMIPDISTAMTPPK